MNAYRDENSVPTLIAVSNANGSSILRLEADPVTHALEISDGTTGSSFPRTNAYRDENSVPVFLVVSSADGRTPTEVYGNLLTGALLVDSS